MLTSHELKRLRALGLAFSMRDGMLAVTPRDRITDVIRNTIRTRRDDFVRLIEAESNPLYPHDIGERAAIFEYDGGYARGEAEALALAHFGLCSWDELSIEQSRNGRCEP